MSQIVRLNNVSIIPATANRGVQVTVEISNDIVKQAQNGKAYKLSLVISYPPTPADPANPFGLHTFGSLTPVAAWSAVPFSHTTSLLTNSFTLAETVDPNKAGLDATVTLSKPADMDRATFDAVVEAATIGIQ